VSIGLEAEVESLFSGGAAPSGTVRFMFKKKTLGTATLADGVAALTMKAASVLGKKITIAYSGDADFTSSVSAPNTLTSNSLKRLARPMAVWLDLASVRIKALISAGIAYKTPNRSA
jgi:hypothetical protein